MDTYKIIEVKESVFADNDREAVRVRQALKQKGTFLLMPPPSPALGCGPSSCTPAGCATWTRV